MKAVNENKKENFGNSGAYKSRNSYTANFVGQSKNKLDFQPKLKEEKNDTAKIRHEKNKAKNISKLMTSFVALVSGTAVFAAGVDAFIPPTTEIVAQIESVFTTESDVSYYIFLENYEGEDDVYVVLYNDFTNRTQKVEEQMMEGTFENLQTNMKYTLAVKKGSQVLASKVVRTVNEEMIDDWYQDEPYEEEPYIEDENPNGDWDDGTGKPNTSDGGDNGDQGTNGGYTNG